jgi:NADH-quinone oxidoreductase subunit N
LRIDYAALAPEIVVAGAACLILLADLALRGRLRVLNAWFAFGSMLLALLLTGRMLGSGTRSTLAGLFVLDDFAIVLKLFFLAVAAFVLWISIPPMRGHRYEGEFVFLLLCSVLGTLLMPSSRDLLMLFIALELVSAPAFVIAGLRKLNPRSNEAALKFFIFGVLSAGVLVYGISLVYGFAGSTSLQKINATAAAQSTTEPLLVLGLLFIVAAFGFKVSAVPFHFWAPDTYEGAPIPLAAFLSVASKAAGFVGLLFVLLLGFPSLANVWAPLVGGIAIATMTVGNVVALRQRHLVRLLAYSSIGHAGYMLIPLAVIGSGSGRAVGVRNEQLIRSLVIYLLVYAVMNLGAFTVAIGASKQYPNLLIRDLSGFGRRAPLPAIAMAGFLISLGGIPPFAGWFAKFAVFIAAIQAGSTLGVVLAVAMVVNSVISLYYYVGVVRVMYLQDPEDEGAVSFPRPLTVATAGALIGVIAFGVYPEPFARLAEAARLALHG